MTINNTYINTYIHTYIIPELLKQGNIPEFRNVQTDYMMNCHPED